MRDTGIELKNFYKNIKKINTLGGVISLLSWDQETFMPERAIKERANQITLLTNIYHKGFLEPSFIKNVNFLFEKKDKLSLIDRRSVEYAKKHLDIKLKLPVKFVESFSSHKAKSLQSWKEAKKTSKYIIFKNDLKKMFEYTKQFANYIDDSNEVYDVLLYASDEDISTQEIKQLFGSLEKELIDMFPKIPEKKELGVFKKKYFNKDCTLKFLKSLLKKFDFDFTRGVIGEVVHPFETKISPSDIRLNITFKKNDLLSVLTSTMHELGHALYEQNIEKKYFDTPLNQGVSIGVHESQSRLLENIVGRSFAFSQFLKALLEKFYDDKFEVEEIYNDLNVVKKSLIRIESDEFTYNFHIILRFEIELKLLSGEITFDNLPEYWNQRMKELLKASPQNDSEGVLQDIHWAMGSIGYFPSYILGNIYGGMIWQNFIDGNPNWEDQFKSGVFKLLIDFLREKVWKFGTFQKPFELVHNLGYKNINTTNYLDYLKRKFL